MGRSYTSYSRSSARALVHIDRKPMARWNVSIVRLSICYQSSVMSDRRIGTNTCPSCCVPTGQQSMRAQVALPIFSCGGVRQCYLLTWCIHLRSMTLTDVILTMWRGLRQPLRTILNEHGSNWDWRLRGRNDITIRHSNRQILCFDFNRQILEINSALHILVLIVWWPNWVR